MTNHPVVIEPAQRTGDFSRRTLWRSALRPLPIAVAMLVATLNPAAAPSALAAGDKVTVDIAEFAFSPAAVTVTPGTTVVWVNHDDSPHTVTATKGSFQSSALDTDDSFAVTFTKAGDFAYFCTLHPHMVGKVVVSPAAG